MRRRQLLFCLMLSVSLSGPLASAWAKDGGDSGGDSGSGDGSDDADNSGSGNSGSGNDAKNQNGELDQNGALAAVASGEAMALELALKKLGQRIPGRVIDVKLRIESSRLVYRFKVKTADGLVRKVVMDAKSGKFRTIFGY